MARRTQMRQVARLVAATCERRWTWCRCTAGNVQRAVRSAPSWTISQRPPDRCSTVRTAAGSARSMHIFPTFAKAWCGREPRRRVRAASGGSTGVLHDAQTSASSTSRCQSTSAGRPGGRPQRRRFRTGIGGRRERRIAFARSSGGNEPRHEPLGGVTNDRDAVKGCGSGDHANEHGDGEVGHD